MTSRVELHKRWLAIRAILDRARQALPEAARENIGQLQDTDLGSLELYRDFIDHNELELALDQLEGLGDINDCRGGFWRDLERAAQLMGLIARAERFNRRFHEALSRVSSAHESVGESHK